MPTLYVIATPIGNLEDIGTRALRVLSGLKYILAEDTRVSQKLLTPYNVKAKVLSWHQHSKDARWRQVKEILKQGNDIGLITDAGTPGLSDPGGKLVELVSKELLDVSIVPIPGPSALSTAISVAGIPMDEFLFLGFLPHKKGRQTKLKIIAASERPVVLFESKHRIIKLLKELAQHHNGAGLATFDKQVIVFRELTKKFESIYRGSAKQVLETIPEKEVKGEFVVIIY